VRLLIVYAAAHRPGNHRDNGDGGGGEFSESS